MLLGRSLDDWRLCDGGEGAPGGCCWYVLRPATRCSDHGGEVGPEYWESEDGEILTTRHMDLLEEAE